MGQSCLIWTFRLKPDFTSLSEGFTKRCCCSENRSNNKLCYLFESNHGIRAPMRGFFLFSNIVNILADLADRQNKLWDIFAQILSRVSLVHDIALFNHFFCKKLWYSYIPQDFLFGIGIGIWAVENLRSSHHASVVRESTVAKRK